MNRSCAIVRPDDEDRRVLALVARELARHGVEPVLRGLDRQAEALALLGLELLQLGLDGFEGHRIQVRVAVLSLVVLMNVSSYSRSA